MRLVASLCAAALLVAAAGCGGSGAPQAYATLTPEEVGALLDTPSVFKGRTVKARLAIREPILSAKRQTLRNYAGKPVAFTAPGRDKARPGIAIVMPMDDVPEGQQGGEFLVTFSCKQGSLTEGNEAIAVERP